MYVFQPAKDLVDERLEMRIGKGLARSNDCRKIALHKLYMDVSVRDSHQQSGQLTFVQIRLIEIIGSWYVHIIQAGNLGSVSATCPNKKP